MAADGIQAPFQSAFERFWINPMTTWDRFFNPQFFINCNVGDADIENHVLHEVGSYGSQLGEVIDAVGVLVSRLDASLTPRERVAVERFRTLARKVDAAVAGFRGDAGQGVEMADAVRLVEALPDLRKSTPAAYRAIVGELTKALPTPRRRTKVNRRRRIGR